MSKEQLEQLTAAANADNLLFVRIGGASVVCKLETSDLRMLAESELPTVETEALGVPEVSDQRGILVMVCSRIVAALLSPEERAAIESLANDVAAAPPTPVTGG